MRENQTGLHLGRGCIDQNSILRQFLDHIDTCYADPRFLSFLFRERQLETVGDIAQRRSQLHSYIQSLFLHSCTTYYLVDLSLFLGLFCLIGWRHEVLIKTEAFLCKVNKIN